MLVLLESIWFTQNHLDKKGGLLYLVKVLTPKICVSTSTAFSGYSICCVYKTLHILTSVEQYVHNTVMDLSRECWNQDFSNGTERT